jgi:hypothetical protein
MLQPRMTHHARQRLQQRGSRAEDVAIVVAYGDIEVPARNGCRYLQLSNKEAAMLQQRAILTATEVDRARRLVVLVGPTGKVVTLLKCCSDRAIIRRRGARR